MTRTLIVSDIHLGARNSQSAALAGLLLTDFDRLVLNGDTIDNLNFRRFRACDWALLHQLRAIANERELILVRGNHEGMFLSRDREEAEAQFGPLSVLARLLGVELHEEYDLWVGRRRYLVLHGDRFDRSLNLSWVGQAADYWYNALQRCSRPAAHWIKGRVKRWGGVVTSVKSGAIDHARRRGYQGVVTGHTHYHDDHWVDGMHYLNSGCWVDRPCTYVLADEDHIQLRHWQEPAGGVTIQPAPSLVSA